MNANLHQILAIATGPKCWRQEMRKKTQPVLALASLPAGLRGLRTRIPPALWGQDLLAMLSRQMREALLGQHVESPVDLPRLTRRRLESPYDSMGALLPAREPLGARSLEPSSPQGGTDGEASDDQQGPIWPELLHPSFPQALKSSSVPANLQQCREAREEPDSWRQETSRLVPPTQQKGETRTCSSARTLLEQELEDYWQLLGQDKPKSAARSAAPVHEGSTAAVAPPVPASQGSSLASWPDLFARQTARKFQQLAGAGVAPMAGPGLTSSTQVHDKVEIQNVFQVNLANDAGYVNSSRTSLAEALADILREQALYHGIDVT